MPAYHSSFTNTNDRLGNMALLPIKTSTRGPAACLPVSQVCIWLFEKLIDQLALNTIQREIIEYLVWVISPIGHRNEQFREGFKKIKKK